ncbi:hypothetical protein BDR26DRAFT_940533 [Obelidium mucronatum]|nr:hypothetical protein BDR26DRAFT_940533 [Obelidium mucronatum]
MFPRQVPEEHPESGFDHSQFTLIRNRHTSTSPSLSRKRHSSPKTTRKRQSSNSSINSSTLLTSTNSTAKRLRQGSNNPYKCASPLSTLRKPGILKRSRSCASQLDLDVEAALVRLSIAESGVSLGLTAVQPPLPKKQHVTFKPASTLKDTIYTTDSAFTGDFTYNFSVIMGDDENEDQEWAEPQSQKQTEGCAEENTNITYMALIREAQRRIEEMD